MMNAHDIVFYLVAAMILGGGIIAVTTPKIFRAAIALLFSLVGIAALYFWMDVQFIAAVQVIVYVGGIVVLIIFSIFLTQKAGDEMPVPTKSRLFFSGLAVFSGLILSFLMVRNYGFDQHAAQPFNTDTERIGAELMNTHDFGYALPFEVVSMLLLAAMIGCIVIAMKATASPFAKEGAVKQEPSEPKISEHA